MLSRKILTLVALLTTGGVFAASQGSFDRQEFSENSEYMYDRLIELTVAVQKNKDELEALKDATRSAVLALESTSESLADTRQSLKFISEYLAGVKEMDHTASINALGSRIDSAQLEIDTLADKLDAEDVTNIDTNYRATLEAL